MFTENTEIGNAPATRQGIDERHTEQEVKEWLVMMLADLLQRQPNEINTHTTFNRYGLDSSAAVGITDSLGTWLGHQLDPTLLYDYPTIDMVGRHLAENGFVKE